MTDGYKAVLLHQKEMCLSLSLNLRGFENRYALKASRGTTASSRQATLLPLEIRGLLNSCFERFETSVEAQRQKKWSSNDVSQRITHGKHTSFHTRSSGGLESHV